MAQLSFLTAPARPILGVLVALLFLASFCEAQVNPPAAGVASVAGWYGADGAMFERARNNVVAYDGDAGFAVINTFLGADRFYNAGIFGQYTVSANVEAGHIWNGHEALGYVKDLAGEPAGTAVYTAPEALGEVDLHATAVGMLIGGFHSDYYYYHIGMAPYTRLCSGALASSWTSPAMSGGFEITDKSFFNAYNHFFHEAAPQRYYAGPDLGITVSGGAADVINSSWGFTDPTGMDVATKATDGFARAYPQTTFVVAAGNEGSSANTVGGPASGYNAISVGAVGNGGPPQTFDVSTFNSVSTFSSRGPQDYQDPLRTVTGGRAGVSLVAPGTWIYSAYYGGQTGMNGIGLPGSTPDETNGVPEYYLYGLAGTSFAAPIVTGGVALLDSASYATGMSAASRDARLIKAVLMNSAKKLPGWDNGQQTNLAGTTVTTQSLDWSQGAGLIDLNRAFDQYLSGTQDVAGNGGSVQSTGWDLGSLSLTAHNDYLIESLLHSGDTLDVTLDWFRNRGLPTLEGGTTVTATDLGFANLDLEVWNAEFTRLYATSMSLYNDTEHLHYLLPDDGQYAIRVLYRDQMFGTPTQEPYGLAWNYSPVPEPGTLALLAMASLAVIVFWRRR